MKFKENSVNNPHLWLISIDYFQIMIVIQKMTKAHRLSANRIKKVFAISKFCNLHQSFTHHCHLETLFQD